LLESDCLHCLKISSVSINVNKTGTRRSTLKDGNMATTTPTPPQQMYHAMGPEKKSVGAFNVSVTFSRSKNPSGRGDLNMHQQRHMAKMHEAERNYDASVESYRTTLATKRHHHIFVESLIGFAAKFHSTDAKLRSRLLDTQTEIKELMLSPEKDAYLQCLLLVAKLHPFDPRHGCVDSATTDTNDNTTAMGSAKTTTCVNSATPSTSTAVLRVP
jgi:hypothetical protein